MEKEFQLTVDLEKKILTPFFEVNTNDLKSVKLIITITRGLVPFNLTGTTARIAIRKPDNNVIFQDCTIKNATQGVVETVLENQAYVLPGAHSAELMCYKGADVVAVSGSFTYKAVRGILSDEAVESKTELTSINRALGDVQATVQDLRENGTGIDAQARQDVEQVTVQLAQMAINVKSLGAKGDGVADDTTSIQNALDYAKTSGSVTVLIPDGVYNITKSLRIHANTTVQFGSKSTLIRKHTGSFFCNWESGDNFSEFNGKGNITIKGGILEGNIVEFSNGFNAINLARGKNITLENVEIRDVIEAHAVDLNACEDVTFNKCRFLGFKKINATYSEAIQISNHTSTSFGTASDLLGSYDGTPCQNIKILHCEFGESGTEGTQAWPVGVGNHSAVHNVFNRNIHIFGNTFKRMTYAGVRGFKFSDTTISENIFEGCQRDIYMDSAWGGISDANKDSTETYTKLPQAGKNIKILNNTYKNTISESIYITGVAFGTITAYYENIKIIGNTVENRETSTANVFSFVWVKDITIDNNTVKNGGTVARFAYCQDFTIGNENLISDLRLDGIVVTEPDLSYPVPALGEPGYDASITSSTVATWYKNKGYTGGAVIGSSKLQRIARNGIAFYACWGFKITNVILDTIATATDTDRDGIRIDNNSKNGEIITPTIKKNPSYVSGTGGANRHAVYVTPSCENVRVQAGEFESKANPVNLLGSNVWNGVYFYAPNGKRYKQIINDSGQPVFSLV